MTTSAPGPFRSIDSASAMRVAGALAVILGGIVAAVTGPLQLSGGSWAAAYLVLVVGVAQIAMGTARRHWHSSGSSAPGWWQFALWNLGSIAVLAGTATAQVAVVFVGAALLVVALVLAVFGTRRIDARAHRLLLLGYRIVLVILALSIPIGVILSALRHA